MKRLFIKKLLISIFFICIIFNINTYTMKVCNAESIDDVITGGDSFIKAADSDKLDTNKMKNASDTVYNILLALGVIVAVTFATILGVQYMTAGAEGQAKVKESMIPFVIGCVVVFGAFCIWKAVVLVFM